MLSGPGFAPGMVAISMGGSNREVMLTSEPARPISRVYLFRHHSITLSGDQRQYRVSVVSLARCARPGVVWLSHSGQVIAATAFLHASMTGMSSPHGRCDLPAPNKVGWLRPAAYFSRRQEAKTAGRGEGEKMGRCREYISTPPIEAPKILKLH